MKLLFTTLLAFSFLFANAQKYQFQLSSDSSILYEKIVTLDTTYNKTVLYNEAKTWFVNTFNSAKDVIQSEDVNTGRIIGKGFTDISIAQGLNNDGLIGYRCYFTIQVDIKNGKYRCRFFDLYSEGINIVGTKFKSSVSQVYLNYLHDKYKGNFMYSKQRFDRNFVNAFTSIDNNINNLNQSLNTAMINSKKENF